jgi:signal transduction histidine kinase
MDFMGGGIGLGLTIAKEIIEAHHGRIIVESVPHKGSVFTVLLPLKYKYETEENVTRI